MPLVKKKRNDILSVYEVKDMIEKANHEYMRCIISLLYLYGMRISEVLSLKKEDIRFDEYYLYCRIRVSKRQRKSKSEQIPYRHTIPVNVKHQFIHYIIDHWYNIDEGNYLFESRINSNEHIDRRTVALYLERLNKSVYPHLFRHTRATRLAEAGASASQLQAWFGWSDMRPATVYVHQNIKMIRKLGDNIE